MVRTGYQNGLPEPGWNTDFSLSKHMLTHGIVVNSNRRMVWLQLRGGALQMIGEAKTILRSDS